ncbi:hypothetical protein Y032_0027g1575 [Ancylostoma ceylanicum]|uniref:Uncharacterized protein n=1 Tax=Ancylostoma ceylanicum TaxID=53326 RepID=A0A016UVT8_9BILA|nr:hypothetical protein Y032_0027g1575 [Ancylostoma ceylanicum]
MQLQRSTKNGDAMIGDNRGMKRFSSQANVPFQIFRAKSFGLHNFGPLASTYYFATVVAETPLVAKMTKHY